MPPVLVRLNLPGFSSSEPFQLANASPSMTGLACAVLEEIGGFTKEELEGVSSKLDQVPLTLLGELCAGQLVELTSDAQLGVFLATAESPTGLPIIEVRPRDAAPPGSFGNSPTSALPPNSVATEEDHGSEQALGGEASSVAAAAASSAAAAAASADEDEVGKSSVGFNANAATQQPAPIGLRSPPRWSTHASHQSRPRTPDPQHVRTKSQGSSRASTPPCERRLPSDGDSWRQVQRGGACQPQAPVHVRLYHEKDQRRRRLEEARLRKLERDEEQIRTSARRALGRAPSPGRTASPSRTDAEGRVASDSRAASPGLGHSQSSVLHGGRPGSSGSRAPTPSRTSPPLPEGGRPSSACRGPFPSSAQPGNGGKNASRSRRHPAYLGGEPGSVPASEDGTTHSSVGSAGSRRGIKPSVPPAAVALAGAVAGQEAAVVGHQVEITTLTHPSSAASPTTSPGLREYSSSIVCDGAHGVQANASVGTPSTTPGGEDSLCGDGVGSALSTNDDMQSLRQVVAANQQRIDFLENMHQQALRQIQKVQEELKVSQQQRFHAADKVLRLEQLVSEMQAQRPHFGGDHAASLRWEDLLRRSSAVLADD